MATLKALLANITQAEVDVIVNAANPRLLGGGGVDGAIHQAAGPTLLDACMKIAEKDGVRCPTGEARITGAGRLAAKYVIHTVGPVFKREGAAAAALLESAYTNSLALALEHGCRSIAFPAISCGIYGYPLEEAAQIAVKACQPYLAEDISIFFYLFNQEIYSIFKEEIEKYQHKGE
ncbi:O-acetyl-ADP-ribose deacetylase [Desulfotalea psychrophila]|uniref:Macro domain-containing protein n=1 Tax=Desulfotalea psychrophila (strain LSv54 / DSM 12343) TaxID=177439 RepID=Q6AKL0_DESPS|nr:O-acetyl-ADP-ribose deacetylase [Desulfotalea psychrophila]CAG37115.1 conserved hypothetical protein [Desulfotalea psychrophila LSv54]